ncbi:OmpA family protein [Xanthomonas maliensis]|uniref:OmpA family protein n=1 Tax=Xanthomonas maliensis TaxID=1321368 RepID=UPI0003A2CC45|nr:OmpA family protein [Xanthomonas maliensis]KAB7769652.1 OmpA family protein [Xanthomonas maliensis]
MRLQLATALALLSLPLLAAGQAQPAAPTAGTDLPIVVEGVVPDQATKSRILNNLRGVYGEARIVDRVQVEAIATPPNWSEYVSSMITPGLKRVSGGKLEVNGQSVRISGQVANEAQRQQVASDLSLASNTSYTVTNSLKLGASEQTVLDQTLANRIIEFQSGSAKLTPLGMSILDEMVAKMTQMSDARFLIVGHTDNVGQRESNLALSQARAQAVKAYLVQKGLSGMRLDVLGKGPDEPVADNTTADGRARNRRIQFKIVQ